MKIKLDPWQKKFIATKGDKILCCGRQVGKTEICAHDCGEYVQNPDNPHPVLMTAPTERQAYNLFEKTLGYLMENHPKCIKMGIDRPTKTKITLKNGIKIFCLPVGASGLGIRGLTVGRSYEDENARIPEEVESAIAPMLLVTNGARIKLSTPHGAVGEFYNTWINKDGAYDSYTRFSITSETVIKDREFCESWTQKQRDGALRIIEQAKARMSNKQFAQEFLGEFIESLTRYFSDKIIIKCCVLKRRDTILRGRKYFMGCDIARMGEDAGTYEIFQKISNKKIVQVENKVTTKQLTWQTENKIIYFDEQYNFGRESIGIDAGAGTLGVSVLDHLLLVDSVKRKIVAINNRKRSINRDENDSSRLVKEDLYDNCRAMMEQGIVEFLDDEEIIESFRDIQYEYIQSKGQPTKIRIFGNNAHIVEGIIRALILAKSKSLNIWVR